jgi:hypothetical protein
MLKRNPRTAWREYGDQLVVITTDDTMVHTLNTTAAFIWKAIGKRGMYRERLEEIVREEFDVAEERMQKEIDTFIRTGIDKKIISCENIDTA